VSAIFGATSSPQATAAVKHMIVSIKEKTRIIDSFIFA